MSTIAPRSHASVQPPPFRPGARALAKWTVLCWAALLPVPGLQGRIPAPSKAPAVQPWPGIQGFLQTQVNSASDRDLLASLQTLYQDSASCRALLEAFWKEQPMIKLTLVTVEGLEPGFKPRKQDPPCFGLLFVQPTASGYHVIVAAQTELSQAGQDLADPWLAQMLFALLQITRRDSVVDLGKRIAISPELQRRMWEFQRSIRTELRASRPDRYKQLAFDGEYLYRVKLP